MCIDILNHLLGVDHQCVPDGQTELHLAIVPSNDVRAENLKWLLSVVLSIAF